MHRFIRFVSLFVFLVVVPASGYPELTALFGPEVFVRGKGKPVTETVEFSPTGYGAPYVLRQILFDWPVDYASPTLVECCGRALAHTLEVLDPELRGDPWTVEAVRWLGEMRLDCAEAALTAIVRERRGFLVHAWPAGVRRVARAALQSMSRRNR